MSVYWRLNGSTIHLADGDDGTVWVYVRARSKKGKEFWKPSRVRRTTLRKAGEEGFTSARSGEKRFSDAYRTTLTPPDEILEQVAEEANVPVEYLKEMDPQERAQYLEAHHDWKSGYRKARMAGFETDDSERPELPRDVSPIRAYLEKVRGALPTTRTAVAMQKKASVLERAGVNVPNYASEDMRQLIEKVADAANEGRVPSFEELGVQSDEEFERALSMYTQWMRGYEAKEAYNRGHYEQSSGLTVSIYYPPLTDDVKKKLESISGAMEQITESRSPDDAYHRARRYASAVAKAFAEYGGAHASYAVAHVPLRDNKGYLLVGARYNEQTGEYENITLGALEPDGMTLIPRTVHPMLGDVLKSGGVKPHQTHNTISRFLMETLQRVGGVRLRSHGGEYWIPAERTAEATHAMRLMAALLKHIGGRMVVTEGVSHDDLRQVYSMHQAAPGSRPQLDTPPMRDYRASKPQPPNPQQP